MSKKINDYKIKVPRIPGGKVKDWKGKDLFDVRYWVASVLGKRRSGKTSLIYTLIKAFANKNTRFIFFVPTFYRDDSYQVIRDYLDRKKIKYQDFQSIEEDGINNLDVIMKVFEREGKEEEDSDEEENGTAGTNFFIPGLDKKEDEEEEEDEEEDEEVCEICGGYDDNGWGVCSDCEEEDQDDEEIELEG